MLGLHIPRLGSCQRLLLVRTAMCTRRLHGAEMKTESNYLPFRCSGVAFAYMSPACGVSILWMFERTRAVIVNWRSQLAALY